MRGWFTGMVAPDAGPDGLLFIANEWPVVTGSRFLKFPHLLQFHTVENTRNARDPSVVHDRRTYIPSSY